MRSVIRLMGGPADGREETPHKGWPAPDRFRPAGVDDNDWYERVSVREEDDRVVHVYQYRPDKEEGNAEG